MAAVETAKVVLKNNPADLRSVTFSNLRKDQEPQLLCNFLMELGACSTSIVDADRGTKDEMALFDEFDDTTMTRTAVTTHVWNHCHVVAHFPASTSLDWIMEIVQDTFPSLPNYSKVDKVENKDWVLHVQQSWKPIVVPPFVLRFPWHSDETVQEALQEATPPADSSLLPSTSHMEDHVELELQGGIAFGTGEHPTTQLCLDFVSRVARPEMLLMDYGAGSGVLGMAACKLDPTIKAIGVDIDVDAVQIANQNAETNKVDMENFLSNLVQTRGDDESTSLLLKAYSSNSKLQDNDEKQANSNTSFGVQVLPSKWNGAIYDACVANILAGPLVTLAPTLAGLVREGAPMGLSGIMSSQANMILEDSSYPDYFDNLQVEKS